MSMRAHDTPCISRHSCAQILYLALYSAIHIFIWHNLTIGILLGIFVETRKQHKHTQSSAILFNGAPQRLGTIAVNTKLKVQIEGQINKRALSKNNLTFFRLLGFFIERIIKQFWRHTPMVKGHFKRLLLIVLMASFVLEC